MIQVLDKRDCCGCHGCAQICPKNCITMEEDELGCLYPVIDKAKCVQCGLCEQACPVLRLKKDTSDKKPKAYAAVNLDENVRENSSSGGIFFLLAQTVIQENGVVFGAAWRDDFSGVEHIVIEDCRDIGKLMGSKYVQSTIGRTYLDVKQYLACGRKVLFSGTPCQIEGLYAFLNCRDPNLICVDIVCHGVPGPAVWKRYAEESKKADNRLDRVTMRDKSLGWKNFSLKMEFSDGSIQKRSLEKDPFMQLFLKNACLRDSCYGCSFKKWNHVSDLTLGDFWGIESVCPEMDDDRGTSVVLIHSDAGKKLMEQIHDRIRIKEVDAEAAMKENSALIQSVCPHPNRELFLRQLEKDTLFGAWRKTVYEKPGIKERMYQYLKKTGLLPLVKRILGK